MNEMNEQNSTAQSHLLEEVGICLRRVGFDTLPIEDQCLPIKWNDKYVCRVSSEGKILYDLDDVERNHAKAELVYAAQYIKPVVEYMLMMERAPQLKAAGVDGDYRVLVDFGKAVLTAHPTPNGMEFITWEWDSKRESVHNGNYFHEEYEQAKHDFVARSGMLPRELVFEDTQLSTIRSAVEYIYIHNCKVRGCSVREMMDIVNQIEDVLMRKIPFGVETLKKKNVPELGPMAMK